VHEPVLLRQCLTGLNPRPGCLYVDGTLGGGGHSSALLSENEGIRLYGIERDQVALAAAGARLKPYADRFQALHGNYAQAKALLASVGVEKVDGVLLDLGVSSPQFDDAERGFSYREEGPLDMRMDRTQSLTAYELVNYEEEQELARILFEYGEEKFSRRIARQIVQARAHSPIETTTQLAELITQAIPAAARRQGPHPARRSFQGLRIAVNNELAPLQQALEDFIDLLNPQGRLCVISFHSLEDRIVKQTFARAVNPCTCPPKIPVCVCGKVPTVRLISRKPEVADEAELERNPRSRSAHLRVVEKL